MHQEYTSRDDTVCMNRRWHWHYPSGPVVRDGIGEYLDERAEQVWAAHYPRAKRLRELRRQWMKLVDRLSMMGHMKLAAFAGRYDCRDCEWIWLACVRSEGVTLRAHDWTYSEKIGDWDDDTMLVAMTIDELRERL